MSRWPECSVAAESRRGEVASILRGTEQKTTIHTLYQSVLSCLRGARRIRKKSYAKVFRASVRAETSRLPVCGSAARRNRRLG
ncbi:hypothetical protein BE939_00730 (plasmid) [Escherichia coli]|nr:hypothetical protein BE939_00730 [Escherichia coli]